MHYASTCISAEKSETYSRATAVLAVTKNWVITKSSNVNSTAEKPQALTNFTNVSLHHYNYQEYVIGWLHLLTKSTSMNVPKCDTKLIRFWQPLMNSVWVVFWLVPFCMWPERWIFLPLLINFWEIFVVHLQGHVVHWRQLFNLF